LRAALTAPNIVDLDAAPRRDLAAHRGSIVQCLEKKVVCEM
jgi:hypothetical protein